MSSFQLRIRGPKAQKVIQTLNSNSKLGELKEEVGKILETNPESLVLKCGFPPVIIEGENQMNLSQLNITSGSTIIAEIDLQRMQIPVKKEIPNEQVPNKDGLIMIRRIIPADNNCLFNSILYALEQNNNIYNKNNQSRTASDLRNYIANIIIQPNNEYSEVVLEKSKSDYAAWIKKETSWGGYIELKILSEYYNVEIVAVSIQTGKAEHFGQDLNTNDRIFLLYDGIHYDILCRNISDDMPKEYDTCRFEKNDIFAYEGCLVLAKQLKQTKQFTDVSSFSLQCGICMQGFKGQADALKHGQTTGHMNFQEIKK